VAKKSKSKKKIFIIGGIIAFLSVFVLANVFRNDVKALKVETEFDENDYEEPINLDYDGIRSIVTEHFPDLGWYHSVWESHKINEDPELVTEDSIDDLTDIIKDLIEVQWRLENNSEKDGLYQFEFLMKHHSKQHLVNLLKYLKDKNE